MKIIEIRDLYNDVVTSLTEQECTCSITTEINGVRSCEIKYPIPVGDGTVDKSSHLNAFKGTARIIDTATGDYNSYVFTEQFKSKDSSGSITQIVKGEHKFLSKMNSRVIPESINFVSVLPSVALARILAYVTGITSGTVSVTTPSTFYVRFGDTVLQAFYKLLEACQGEFDFLESAGQLTLVSQLGSNKYKQVRANKNLDSLRNTRFSRDIKNILYGVGGNSPPVTIASARHVVSGYVSGTGVLTTVGNKVVAENDSWNNFKIRMITGAEVGNAFTISDCAAGASNDTITISTGASIAAGDKFTVETSGAGEVPYIRAGVSIATYDTFVGSYRDESVAGAINLLETPMLDGTYSSGLCAGWTKNGTPTVSENTSAGYIQYGSKSQRVQGAANNAGVYQVTAVSDGKYYSISAWVYIVSGNVQLEVVDSGSVWNITKNATGWQRFTITEKVAGTSLGIRLFQDGAGTCEFYLDAVMLSEGVLNRSFTENCDTKVLWDATYDLLIKLKDPRIEYEINFVDLFNANKSVYAFDEVLLGDTVNVFDPDLGIEGLTARIKTINQNIFQPELTRYTIANIIG